MYQRRAIDNDYIHLTFQGRHNDKSAIRLTVQGAGVDANTAALCKDSMYTV